jgi:hypothetical protein
MSKHTPGPWLLHGRITQGNHLPCSAVTAKTLIAKVYSEAYNDIDEETANAILIAAAPELLVELKKASAMLSRCGFESSDEYQSAMAAIAKAEGAQ